MLGDHILVNLHVNSFNMNTRKFFLSVFVMVLSCMFFTNLSSIAQNTGQKLIDSLKAAASSKVNDTNKMKALYKLAKNLQENEPQQALRYAEDALNLSKNLNKKKTEANCLQVIGNIYNNLSEYHKGIEYQEKALKIFEEINDKSGMERCFGNIGNNYTNLSDYSKALEYQEKSLKICEELHDKFSIEICLLNIGSIYDDLANYPKALEYDEKSLRLAEESGNKQQIGKCLNNIGLIYEELADFPRSLEYFEKALKIKEELGDKPGIAGCFANKGMICADLSDYPKALEYYEKSLKMFEVLGDKQDFAIVLMSIGGVYNKLLDYTKALQYLEKSLKMFEELGIKHLIAHDLKNIGQIYIKKSDCNKALEYANKSLSIGQEIEGLSLQCNALEVISEAYEKMGKSKKALEYYKMFIKCRDSLINKENTKKTVQIQMQYEFDKKESIAKAEQQRKDAIALAETQKQKLFRNVIIGGFALLLILGVIISIIVNQRREIRLIKHERNRISRELHDDIGAELNRITMISQHLHQKTNEDEEMQEKLMSISETGKKVLGSIGEIIWTMNPQKNNLASLFAYIRRYVTEYLEMNGIEVHIDFPDEIPVNSITDEYRRNVFLVIKEAIYNITKYSRASRVMLSLKFLKRIAEVKISDNGIGFSVNEKQQWGNGLRNMDQRMKDIGGVFQISSEQNQGTLISLNFPV